MRKSRLLSLMGRRSAAAAGPVRTLKRQPVPEALEPRCLMAATGLSATGTSLHEKFDRSFSADVANFTATGTQLSARSFAATIDWSDGVTSKGTIVLENKAHRKFEVKGTHKFTDGGSNPTATVTIMALGAGPSAKVTTLVKVKGAPLTMELPLTPYAPAGPPAFSGIANVPVISTLDFLEGYLRATTSDYTGTVNWGDGTTAPLTSSNFVFNGQVNGHLEVQVTATHSYTALNSYPITVTVQDVRGQSTVLNGTATVYSPASLQMINPGTVSAGSVPPAPPQIAYFDGAAGTTLSDYSFTIDWGDNRSSTTPDFFNPTSNAGTLLDDHQYDDLGGDNDGLPYRYTITVSVTGPGIDPANPLVVKDTIYVTHGGSFF
jgi:hypothetical protein